MSMGVVLVGVLMLGVIAMAGGPPSSPGGTTGDAPPQGGGAGDGTTPPAIRDGMTAAEVQELLKAERDRQDMKLKGDREKLVADAKAEAKREADEERRKADMSEIDRANAEKAAAESKLKQLEEQLAQTQSAATRAQFVAANAADLDVAWRHYLDGQLAAAPDSETMEAVLARVRDEHKAATGRTAPLGAPGRPAGQPPLTGSQTMNEEIRKLAGRRTL